MCFTVLIIPYGGENVKGLRHNNFEYVWCGTIVQSVQSWVWVGFLWNVTRSGVWNWWVCTKRCGNEYGFCGRRGGKKSDKWGWTGVCKWVGDWDRGWWRKRRWETGSLGGGGE